MRIEQLREFHILAQTLNFTKAAEILDISQPVLSAHIKSMEAELGFELFKRSKHAVELSAIGQQLHPKIDRVLDDYDRVLEIALQAKRALAANLKVGYLFNAYRRIIPDISRKFSNRHPDITLTLRSFEYLDSVEALQNGSVDVILSMDVDESLHETCDMKTLGIDEIFCVVRRDDPLATLDVVSLSDLQDEPLILPSHETSGAYAHFIERLLTRAGIKTEVALYYQEIDTRYLAIEAGEGVGLVGGHFRPYMNQDLKFIPVIESYSHYDLVAIWKKANTNASIAPFVEMVEKEFARTHIGVFEQ